MSGWGNTIYPSGNQTPKFANTRSRGAYGPNPRYAGNTYGVSTTEKANTQGIGHSPASSGWVYAFLGTGPVKSITITSTGAGINSNGYITFTGGGGTGANASYFVSSNANSTLNVVTSIVLNNPGSGYNAAPVLSITGGTIAPVLTPTMGGRCGRVTAETLVAMKHITPGANNTLFPGA